MEFPMRIDDSRMIIHVDMDAFYASIEMRDEPIYKTKPLIIAHDPRTNGGHGVVATANYVARQFGVHSAMSASEALELCPDAIFKKPDFTKYREVSHQIHEIFHEYTDEIEPVALDEAYLDVTNNKKNMSDSVLIAHEIQKEIFAKTNLTCSTGISYNKFLAKLASEYEKPVGVAMVFPEDVTDFLNDMPIESFRGVGKKTIPKMHDLGVHFGRDLLSFSESDLIHYFGKFGYVLYRQVRGIDDRPVAYQRERKSIGKEDTYINPLTTDEEVELQLRIIAQNLLKYVTNQQKHGKTIVLKLRYTDFETITRRITLDEFVPNDAETYYFYARQIFDDVGNSSRGIRLLGITLTNLTDVSYQDVVLPLFKRQD
ncbi:impB/mucB/samB family protein [Pediococcus claussenii ATCC BAA-344]|uniref:DNA polymerase IV n=2 Tax=Pediococcus claussenii TaxID=187452 RepID=G8PCM6_PEDCP|nr:impB/mucB/samB family protein [Pediococcus claussenii ATCC BAA-344]